MQVEATGSSYRIRQISVGNNECRVATRGTSITWQKWGVDLICCLVRQPLSELQLHAAARGCVTIDYRWVRWPARVANSRKQFMISGSGKYQLVKCALFFLILFLTRLFQVWLCCHFHRTKSNVTLGSLENLYLWQHHLLLLNLHIVYITGRLSSGAVLYFRCQRWQRNKYILYLE